MASEDLGRVPCVLNRLAGLPRFPQLCDLLLRVADHAQLGFDLTPQVEVIGVKKLDVFGNLMINHARPSIETSNSIVHCNCHASGRSLPDKIQGLRGSYRGLMIIAMASPASGNVMVRRDDARTYFVVDADTKATIVGPFDRQTHALGVAHSLALKRNGRVADGLHRDVSVIAAKLREAQTRVEELAEQCRNRARELSRVCSSPATRTAPWQASK